MFLNFDLSEHIWEGVPALSPVSLCVKSANATTIRIRWHGHVFKDMLISVDVVPALFFSNFWPPNVSKTALLTPKIKENGIHVVFALHNDKFFESQEKHFRLSFSLAETEIFISLPEQVCRGYILAKAIRNSYVCPQIAPKTKVQTSTHTFSEMQMECLTENDEEVIDCPEQGLSRQEWQHILESEEGEEVEAELIEPVDNDIHADKIITTYLLKNALFSLVNKSCNRELGVDLQNNSEDQATVWAKLIYDYIEDCLTEKRLSSFFIPSCNLLNKAYDGGQHELVFKSGAEFEPLPTTDDDDESQDFDETEEDFEYLRKLFVKMLRGILQSH